MGITDNYANSRDLPEIFIHTLAGHEGDQHEYPGYSKDEVLSLLAFFCRGKKMSTKMNETHFLFCSPREGIVSMIADGWKGQNLLCL